MYFTVWCNQLHLYTHPLQEGIPYQKPKEAEVLYAGKESKSAASRKGPSAEQHKKKDKPSTERQQSQEKYDYRSHSE